MPGKTILLFVLNWICCATALAAQQDQADAAAQAKLDFFENKIRPVLVEYCYECHSGDSTILQGGLRLDSRDAIRRGGDSGEAVVPHDAEASLILEALRYESFEMPPDQPLPDHVIADFEKWIEDGAIDPRESGEATEGMDWKKAREHWSFQPVSRPTVPLVENEAWPRTDIDRFILAKLESKGIRPNSTTADHLLVRRLYLDLIGLPPTPEQVLQFTNDTTPDRVEKLVNQLLADKHFGERWGRHWLDVARYSDSSGGGRVLIFHDAWRYRDYVVQSMINDKPVDQFFVEQIAGDVLPFEDHRQRATRLTATGFLMLGPHNYELQDKELLRMEIIDEQIDVIGRAFLGLTLGCARCHDHKFDPITTEEYYGLAGIFRGTHSVEHANVSRFVESALPLEPAEQQELNAHQETVAALTEEITKHDTLVGGLTNALADQILNVEALGGKVIDDEQATLNGKWTRSQSVKPFVGVGYQHSSDPGAKAVFEFEIPKDGEFEFRVSYTHHSNRSPGTRVLVNGGHEPIDVTINQKKAPQTNGVFHSIGTVQCKADRPVTVEVQVNAKGATIIDAVQMIPISPDGATAETELAGLNELQSLLKTVADLQTELAELNKRAPQPPPKVMSVREGDEIGDYHVCIRGNAHSLSDQPAPRSALSAISADVDLEIESGSSGRLELAEWIVDPTNPLTARVYVNRVWLHLMGEGLVSTTDNFGLMGQTPVHPELLDHLATEFVENGWSTKWLIREITSSRVYLQSSGENPESNSADPDNQLFWRANRRRLDAEVIRDSILAFSGQIDLTVGGPVVPKELKREFGYEHKTNRRSIYLPIFRNTLHDLLDVFDFPNPNLVAGRRNESTLPAQALYLMNSPFVIEQSKHAAERLLAIPGLTSQGRAERAFRIALGRPPSESEWRAVQEFMDHRNETAENELEIWTDICQTLISSLDFRYVE